MPHDGEDLSGRDLSGADLSGSNFKGVDLSGADLHGATLQGVNFKNANLENADLSDADLSGANLKNATLVGADLDGATLAGANLKHAVFEEGANETDDLLSSLVGSVVTGAIITVGVALLVAGWSEFWVVFVLGFVTVLPASIKLAEWYESRETGEESGSEASEEADGQQAALATLRERYASGEIDEAEFERRVERLLETESVEDAETAYGNTGTDAELEQESEPTDIESEESSGTVDAGPEKEPE